MELLLGSHVREHGNRLGRLTGFELEPATRVIRRLLIVPDGDSGTSTLTRPFSAIAHVHDSGEVELRTFGEDVTVIPYANIVSMVIDRSTRLYDGSGDAGRPLGVEVDSADRSIVAILAKPHWWSRRADWPVAKLDFSKSGEIRLGNTSHRAA